MSGTIQYGENGAIDPKSDQADEAKGYSEEGSEEVVDPTAMSGTLETSGTTGEIETAEDVSPVFDLADEQAAENPVPEGTLAAPEVDPAATGEDALEPNYDEAEADKAGAYDPADHKVAEVLDYFKSADDAEVQRVIDAEKAGDGRKGIVEYKKA